MKEKNIIELQNELIAAFPSHDIKKWYKVYSPQWTISQMATLAYLYFKPHHLSVFLKNLAKLSDIATERAYLKSASKDASKRNYKRHGLSDRTEHLYDFHRKSIGDKKWGCSCLYECCRLPLGIAVGDVVSYRYRGKKQYAVICALPKYTDRNYDISDEWIMAYPLDEKCKDFLFPVEQDDTNLLFPDFDFVRDQFVPEKYWANLLNLRILITSCASIPEKEWSKLYHNYEETGERIDIREYAQKYDRDLMLSVYEKCKNIFRYKPEEYDYYRGSYEER